MVTFTYDFWMDKVEVTQADYTTLMKVNPSANQGGASFPVENMTWFDAVLYCNERSRADSLDTVYVYAALSGTPGDSCFNLENLEIHYEKSGYRLPTEAEFEYACRGGSATTYFWGGTGDSATASLYAWHIKNSANATHEVGGRQVNPFGLYDIIGNVWEKCNDWYDTYSISPQSNPIGPDAGPSGIRTARGACFASEPADLKCADRGYNVPDQAYAFIGFRVVRPRTNPF
jgi:formylglycine-generating enzyme required for sulfatase activity